MWYHMSHGEYIYWLDATTQLLYRFEADTLRRSGRDPYRGYNHESLLRLGFKVVVDWPPPSEFGTPIDEGF